MLQAGYVDALADGTSHEQRSTDTDHSTGQQLAHRVVERGVLLPGGQGVHIQQALQQVSMSESDLGKRKLHDDLVRMELEERVARCEQLRIENSTQKIAAVLRFAEAMTMLDSEWKNDRWVVLQTQDVLKSNFFRDSAAAREPAPLALGGGATATASNASSRTLASISISQVALEMNVKLKHGEAVQIGTLVSKLYKEKYGSPPPKHDQFVDGAVRSVNSYTTQDTDLVEASIRARAKK